MGLGSDFQDNDISSVRVYSGCRVDIWENEDRTGWHASLGPGDYNGADFASAGGADNQASSMKVFHPGPCVKLFDHSTLDNDWAKEFGPGDYIGVPSAQETASNFQNDDISSVRVYSECSVDIWENEDRTGWHVSLGPGDYNGADFASAGGADNQASSMKVSHTGPGGGIYPMAFSCKQ